MLLTSHKIEAGESHLDCVSTKRCTSTTCCPVSYANGRTYATLLGDFVAISSHLEPSWALKDCSAKVCASKLRCVSPPCTALWPRSASRISKMDQGKDVNINAVDPLELYLLPYKRLSYLYHSIPNSVSFYLKSSIYSALHGLQGPALCVGRALHLLEPLSELLGPERLHRPALQLHEATELGHPIHLGLQRLEQPLLRHGLRPKVLQLSLGVEFKMFSDDFRPFQAILGHFNMF